VSLATRPSLSVRSLGMRTTRAAVPLPDGLRSGLIFSPNLATLDDTISGLRATADGTTWNDDGEYRAFNGTTDRLDFPNVRDLGTTPGPSSFFAWIYATQVAAGLRIIWTDELATGPSQAVIFRQSATALDFSHAYSVTGLRRLTNAVLTVNTWHAVGYSYSGSGTATDCTIYVNGSAVGSYATTTNASGTPRGGDGPWCLGGRQESDAECFQGRIRAPMVWDRVLTAAEFASLAALPRPA
jgi:hypothetical protein